MNKSNTLKCKHCGNNEYFYTKEKVYGDVNVIFNSGRSYEDQGLNAEMYEHIEHKLKSKFYFCYACDKKVSKIEEDY